MTIQEIFSSNLRKYRKAMGLSQEKLAELAGLHRTYIGGIEQKRVNVSLKNIGKIADALNVDPALLLLPEEPKRSIRTSAMAEDDAQSSDERNTLRPGAAAVAVWSDAGVSFHPVKIAQRDLTIHVIAELIDKGYSGDELMQKYAQTVEEIDAFLSE